MIHSIIRTAVHRPISVFMIALGVAIFGTLSLTTLPQEFLPAVSTPQISISTSYPSASPKEVRSLITIPLEDALASVSGMKNISSVSRNSTSTIVLDFEWGTDMLKAGVETREIIDNQYQSLPNAAGKPLVLPVNANQEALLILSMTPHVPEDIYQLRENARKEIKTEIQQIEGVGNVVLVGGTREEIAVDINVEKLQSKGYGIDTLSQMIKERNVSYPVGTFIDGPKEYIVKTDAELHAIRDLQNLELPTKNQSDSFPLHSVADVYFSKREQQSYFSVNGNEAIALVVYPKPGNYSVRIAEEMKEKVTSLSQAYPDYAFEIVFDASDQIRKNVSGVLFSLSLGAIAAFLVVFLLLKNIRLGLILIFSLPMSLLITFIVMKIHNISLNALSLSGLSIGIGMLVDNSVVVLENINAKLQHNSEMRERKRIYIDATYEMATSTFGSTITSIIVFIPLMFLPAIVGELYKDLAITISTSLLASFFVAITMVPIGYVSLFRGGTLPTTPPRMPLQGNYGRVLRYCITHPFLTSLSYLLLLSLIAGVYVVRVDLFPNRQEAYVDIQVKFPPNTSMEHIAQVDKKLTRAMLKESVVTSVFSRAGGESNDLFYWANAYERKENLYLTLIYKKKYRYEEIQAILAPLLSGIDADSTIEPPKDKVAMLLGLDTAGEEFIYTLSDFHSMQRELEHKKNYFPEDVFSSVEIIPGTFTTELVITPQREPMMRTLNTPSSLTQYMNATLYGSYAGKITISDYDYNIRIRLPEAQRNDIEYIHNLPISSGRENQPNVSLKNIARVAFAHSAPLLVRVNKKDVLLVRLEAQKGGNTTDVAAYTGDLFSINTSIIKENIAYMLSILILSIILLYLFLGIQFESAWEPLIILLSIPLSIVGVVVILAITHMPLTMNAILGILVLFGITVNNSILLKDALKASARTKTSTSEHIVRTCSRRFRPIVITTLTTITALLPSAFGLFSATEQRPLALVIIGGLFASTLFSLFLVPVLTSGYKKRQ